MSSSSRVNPWVFEDTRDTSVLSQGGNMSGFYVAFFILMLRGELCPGQMKFPLKFQGAFDFDSKLSVVSDSKAHLWDVIS